MLNIGKRSNSIIFFLNVARMPTHVTFFWYKINQKIVIVFRFVIKIIVQNVQITKRNESTQIEDGWRNAVDEPKIQHVCPYWRPPSSLALFLSSSLSLLNLPLPFLLPSFSPRCNPSAIRLWRGLSSLLAFIRREVAVNGCLYCRAHHFTFRLGANTRTHGWHLRYITAVPLRELSRVYPSWVKNYR